jgi:hypothetical protein
MKKNQIATILCIIGAGIIPILDTVSAAESCNRTATVNYQEVLIDTSPTLKGEGLRYFLDRDPVALSHLDQYQKTNKTKWPNAVMGITGVSLLLGGVFTKSTSGEGPFGGKKLMIMGGTAVLLLNYLIAKTISHRGEEHLFRAVEEYNSRNLPHIIFSPAVGDDPKHFSPGFGAGIYQSF